MPISAPRATTPTPLPPASTGRPSASGAARRVEKTVIVIPARDEAATVGRVAAEAGRTLDCPVVVVDDASRDDTAGAALAAGAVVLPLAVPSGPFVALQTGLRYALSRGFTVIVSMDADGQHLAHTLPGLVAARAVLSADVVIGRHPARGGPLRRAARLALGRLAGGRLTDATSGLRVHGRRAAEALLSDQAALFDYQDVGGLMLFRSAGMRVVEVDAPMDERRHGRSRIFASWTDVAAHVLTSLSLCLLTRPGVSGRAGCPEPSRDPD